MCKHCPDNGEASQRQTAQPRPPLAEGMSGADGAEHAARTKYSRNYAGPFRKTPDRLLGIGLVRLYQLTLSGFVGNACRHLPTCSEYGYEAIARYGLWPGGWMTLFRVGRCGPGGSSGFDPVPEQLEARYHWWTPWRYFRLPGKRAGH